MNAALLEPGREIGGYRIEGLLGQTSWATTYAAVASEDRYVALKVLELDVEHEPEKLAILESTLVALVDVADAGVLAPIDAGEIDELGKAFVVTPLASHPSLAELVAAQQADRQAGGGNRDRNAEGADVIDAAIGRMTARRCGFFWRSTSEHRQRLPEQP